MPSALEGCSFAATRFAREYPAHALAGQQHERADEHSVVFRDHSLATDGGPAPACRIVGLQSRANQMEPTLGAATPHLIIPCSNMATLSLRVSVTSDHRI